MAKKDFSPKATKATIKTSGASKKEEVKNEEGVETSVEGAETDTDNKEDNKEESNVTDGNTEGSTDSKDSEDSKTESTEDNKEEGKAEVVMTATKNSRTEKNVKVKLSKPYKCCVGGVWYHLEADKQISVPENVKIILSKEPGLLKPL